MNNRTRRAPLPFSKMQALANDYILFDAFLPDTPLPTPQQMALLCRRWTGVGADGVLLLSASSDADAEMRIFNADGSEAEMCGNGIRCAAWYLHLVRGMGPRLSIQTAAGLRRTVVHASRGGEAEVTAELGAVTPIPGVPENWLGFSVGNPHACLQVPDVAAVSQQEATKQLARCGAFPNGVNVGFWQPDGAGQIRLRVFERGVGETAACGTGAAAAAAAAIQSGICEAEQPVRVLQCGGALTVSFDGNGTASLCGSAQFLFAGSLPFWEDLA